MRSFRQSGHSDSIMIGQPQLLPSESRSQLMLGRHRNLVAFCHNCGMHTLRSSKFIAKLVLVWFALFLGTAIASAIIKPGSMQMVCSPGGGMKMVDTSSDDGEFKTSAGMDCPLCASVTAPPPPLSVRFEKSSPLAHALQPIAAAHIASVTAPPLPSRGPPTSLL